MKSVWLSEQDRAVIRVCLQMTAIGESSLADLRSLLKAEDAIALDAIVVKDVLLMAAEPVEYKLEDAWVRALQSVLEDGRTRLLKSVAREYVRCVDRFEAAKDVEAAK